MIGIYYIKNKMNGKVYIGKSKNVENRLRQHKHYLCKPEHDNKRINEYLHRAVQKYGWDCFETGILERFDDVDEMLLRQREMFWIGHFLSTDSDYGYNLRKDSRTNMIVHEKTRQKISKRLRKEWQQGVRDDHSKKLMINWEENTKRKELQRDVFRKTLTKYQYILYIDCAVLYCDYQELCGRGLKNVIATFHKKKSDTVKFKGIWVEREKLVDPLLGED